jgi:hypothetical protein
LDAEGQLLLRTPLNVFIGGQILDRGITIRRIWRSTSLRPLLAPHR